MVTILILNRQILFLNLDNFYVDMLLKSLSAKPIDIDLLTFLNYIIEKLGSLSKDSLFQKKFIQVSKGHTDLFVPNCFRNSHLKLGLTRTMPKSTITDVRKDRPILVEERLRS